MAAQGLRQLRPVLGFRDGVFWASSGFREGPGVGCASRASGIFWGLGHVGFRVIAVTIRAVMTVAVGVAERASLEGSAEVPVQITIKRASTRAYTKATTKGYG